MMSALLLTLALAASLPVSTNGQQVSTGCNDYQLFIARGSDEPYPGRAGTLITNVCGKLTSGGKATCGYEDIVFNANVSSAPAPAYCISTAEGSANGQSQMKSYAGRCGNSNLILIGYSQGGIVAQDVMGGGGGLLFDCDQVSNPPFKKTESPGSQIVAALTFGSVRHTPNQPFSYGPGADFPGVRPRAGDQLQGLKVYEDRYRDWCNLNDPICAVGSKPVIVANHLNYFQTYADEAATWLAQTAVKNGNQGGEGGSKSSSSTVASTTTEAPTAASIAAGSAATETPGADTQDNGGKSEDNSAAGRNFAEPVLVSALCFVLTLVILV